jgi:hypothetical protein
MVNPGRPVSPMMPSQNALLSANSAADATVLCRTATFSTSSAQLSSAQLRGHVLALSWQGRGVHPNSHDTLLCRPGSTAVPSNPRHPCPSRGAERVRAMRCRRCVRDQILSRSRACVYAHVRPIGSSRLLLARCRLPGVDGDALTARGKVV